MGRDHLRVCQRFSGGATGSNFGQNLSDTVRRRIIHQRSCRLFATRARLLQCIQPGDSSTLIFRSLPIGFRPVRGGETKTQHCELLAYALRHPRAQRQERPAEKHVNRSVTAAHGLSNRRDRLIFDKPHPQCPSMIRVEQLKRLLQSVQVFATSDRTTRGPGFSREPVKKVHVLRAVVVGFRANGLHSAAALCCAKGLGCIHQAVLGNAAQPAKKGVFSPGFQFLDPLKSHNASFLDNVLGGKHISNVSGHFSADIGDEGVQKMNQESFQCVAITLGGFLQSVGRAHFSGHPFCILDNQLQKTQIHLDLSIAATTQSELSGVVGHPIDGPLSARRAECGSNADHIERVARAVVSAMPASTMFLKKLGTNECSLSEF